MHKLLFGVTNNIDSFPLLCRNECAYSHFSMPETVCHTHWYGFSTLRMPRWPLRLICLKEPHIAHMIWFISSVVMKRNIIHLITHYTHMVYHYCGCEYACFYVLCMNLFITHFDTIQLLNFYQCFINNIWLILQCMQPILKRATILSKM